MLQEHGYSTESAFNLASFKAAARQLALCDISTDAGRRNAIAASCNGESMITLRAVLAPRAALGKANDTLATLQDLSADLGAFVSYLLTTSADGTIPVDLKEFSVEGPRAAQADGTYVPNA